MNMNLHLDIGNTVMNHSEQHHGPAIFKSALYTVLLTIHTTENNSIIEF